MPIQRVTLFRVSDEKNVQPIIDAYKRLEKENERVTLSAPITDRTPFSKPRQAASSLTPLQDGKPYIRQIKCGPSLSGPERGKSYTFVAMTRFDNMDDVNYYDEECEAHKRLKEFAHDKVQQPWEPPLTVFFED